MSAAAAADGSGVPGGLRRLRQGPTRAASLTSLASAQGAYLPIRTGGLTLLPVLIPVCREIQGFLLCRLLEAETHEAETLAPAL
jgi:hypothetical protein